MEDDGGVGVNMPWMPLLWRALLVVVCVLGFARWGVPCCQGHRGRDDDELACLLACLLAGLLAWLWVCRKGAKVGRTYVGTQRHEHTQASGGGALSTSVAVYTCTNTSAGNGNGMDTFYVSFVVYPRLEPA